MLLDTSKTSFVLSSHISVAFSEEARPEIGCTVANLDRAPMGRRLALESVEHSLTNPTRISAPYRRQARLLTAPRTRLCFGMTFEQIVASYVRDYRGDARTEVEAFRNLPSLRQAIKSGALCHWLPSHRSPSRRHPHQRRIPGAVLQAVEQRLQSVHGELGRATSFDELIAVVETAIRQIHGIGDLAVYDIARRIGGHLRKEPAQVYLHAGTRLGASALGFRGKTLDPARLPAAFSRLSSAEVEDCLCIYKVLNCAPQVIGSYRVSKGAAVEGEVLGADNHHYGTGASFQARSRSHQPRASAAFHQGTAQSPVPRSSFIAAGAGTA